MTLSVLNPFNEFVEHRYKYTIISNIPCTSQVILNSFKVTLLILQTSVSN